MNLCELPFAMLSTRSNGRTVMRFSFEDAAAEPGLVVRRTLTVKGDPELGLPTSADEEIYLAGMKYTHDYNGFASALVYSRLSK